jgi:hypothetical protein
LSRILLILASSSGVNFSRISKDFKLSYNWATVRAPINPESTWGYLRVHAIAKWVNLHPSSLVAISEIYLRFFKFFSVALGLRYKPFNISIGKGLFLSLNLLSSSPTPSKYFPVRKPPQRGLQATSP